MINNKQKNYKILTVLTNKEGNQTNLEMNIILKKKRCYIRYKRKISKCCTKVVEFLKKLGKCLSICLGGFVGGLGAIVLFALWLGILFILLGGWAIFF